MGDRDWRGTVIAAAELLELAPDQFRISFALDGMMDADQGVEGVRYYINGQLQPNPFK
jgi:hypothetical protein